VKVTINCIFFGMALSDDTYQFLFVSYVLASGHDLNTVQVWLSPKARQQRQPHGQGSWLGPGPDQPAGPHFSRLLMTSWALGKDIGRDSPFHVGLHTRDTKQLINLNLKLQSHVVRQCQSGAWNVASTSSRKEGYLTRCLQRILYSMSIYETKWFNIL
jgi:hypothetical protein